MIKFIHTGDIHLGLKFHSASFDRDKAMDRRFELWSTFQRIVEYSMDSRANFLFIAGDLFEATYFTLGDIMKVRDIFAQAKDVNIIITAGNHDCLDNNSMYKMVEWSENVTVFSSNKIEEEYFLEENTSIFGYSWERSEYRENKVFDESIKLHNDRTNILVIHGDIGLKSAYLPLDLEDLKKLKMDYVALGHIHKPNFFTDKIAYCGSPEPLDFGEVGERGFIEGTIDKGIVMTKFIPFSKRNFYEIDVSIDGTMGYLDILKLLKSIETGSLTEDFYRVHLLGYVHKDVDLEDLIRDLEGDFYHIEILDKTSPDYDLDSLEEDNRHNIIGQFIKAMKHKDLGEEKNRHALYFGLEALLKDR